VIHGASSASPVTEAESAIPSAHAALRWQRATITQILARTAGIRSYFLALPEPLSFLAGQHVDVRLTAPDGYQARRSYSIASTPETSGTIELVIERLDNGEVSPFFHDVAVVGDVIELRGPIGGHFIWSTPSGGPLILVGGGSGVVPLMCMIRQRAAQGSTVPTLLLFSAKTWDDVIFRDELLALDAANNGFELVLALTRDGIRRPGDYSRRVDAAMMRDVLARTGSHPRYVFVCGSNPFVESASQGLIDASIAAALIRTERYGG
jgi:ferredoxin-NADP reductase